MARPSVNECRALECLEGVSAYLWAINDLANELVPRLETIEHRAGPDILRALGPMFERVQELQESAGRARKLIFEVLTIFQEQRVKSNRSR